MEQNCIRCRRPAPPQDSDAFTEWEAADESGVEVICPGCVTREEETAMVDDYSLIPYEIELAGGDPDDET